MKTIAMFFRCNDTANIIEQTNKHLQWDEKIVICLDNNKQESDIEFNQITLPELSSNLVCDSYYGGYYDYAKHKIVLIVNGMTVSQLVPVLAKLINGQEYMHHDYDGSCFYANYRLEVYEVKDGELINLHKS